MTLFSSLAELNFTVVNLRQHVIFFQFTSSSSTATLAVLGTKKGQQKLSLALWQVGLGPYANTIRITEEVGIQY